MDGKTFCVSDGPLEVAAVRDGAEMTFFVRGELDLSNVETARSRLATAEEDETLERIVIDLQDLHFIDSTGLEWLIRAMQRSQADSDRLRVTQSTRDVQRLLEITGVSKYLPRLSLDTDPRQPQVSGAA
jgi:anti-anti-sigma factor